MMRKALLAGAGSVALLLGGCHAAVSGNQAAHGPADWDGFVSRTIDGYLRINPDFAVYQGKHEYDGQIPDWSPEGLQRRQAFVQQAINDAQAFDAEAMTPEQRYQRDYVTAAMRGQLFWLATADQPHTNPAYYIGSLDPSVYITRPYAPPAQRLRAYITYLRNVPRAAEQIRANLRAPLPVSFIDFGKAGFGGFAEYFRGDGKRAFADVHDAQLQADLNSASEAAATAMQGLADWVESQRAQAGTNFALGAERFSQMLRDTEMVDLPLDQLQRIGEQDLQRNQAALREACARYAAGQTIEACTLRMQNDKPAGGPVAAARAELDSLRQFVIDHDIVSVPSMVQAQVEESPPYNRQNSAYISIAGPYEHNLPSVYYISPPDPSWTPEVQRAFVPGKADLLFTTVHEVWPGHYLNFLHANRSHFLFGQLFVGYAYAEGWAHYAEEMMWDAGLNDGDPETHVGQLSNALLRDCRFLSAIGLHTGRMTQEQSYQMFRTQCYQDEGNARQQAARGTYDPAYLNYTLGKLMIRKLREDWTANHGGRQGWKAFHDQFLSYGGPPIPLVRQQMMREPTPRSVF